MDSSSLSVLPEGITSSMCAYNTTHTLCDLVQSPFYVPVSTSLQHVPSLSAFAETMCLHWCWIGNRSSHISIPH